MNTITVGSDYKDWAMTFVLQMSLSIVVFGLGSSTKRFALTSHIKLIQVRCFMYFLSTSAFSTCVASEGLWRCILLGVAGLSLAAKAFRFHLGTKWVCAALPTDRSVWSLFLLAIEKGGEFTRPSRGKARLTLVAAVSLSLHLCWSVFFTRSACFCCLAWSASACIQMALLPLSALHCRVSLFCCFLNCNLPGTDKEDSANLPPPHHTFPPGEFKTTFYKVMHLNKLMNCSFTP